MTSIDLMASSISSTGGSPVKSDYETVTTTTTTNLISSSNSLCSLTNSSSSSSAPNSSDASNATTVAAATTDQSASALTVRPDQEEEDVQFTLNEPFRRFTIASETPSIRTSTISADDFNNNNSHENVVYFKNDPDSEKVPLK